MSLLNKLGALNKASIFVFIYVKKRGVILNEQIAEGDRRFLKYESDLIIKCVPSKFTY